MKGFLRGSLLAVLLGIALVGCSGGGDDDGSDNPPGALAPTVVVEPLALPGPYQVACSNIAQNFGSLTASEVEGYWEGSSDRYVIDLLAGKANTLIATVNAPDDSDLYGDFAGKSWEFAVIVCYPTTSDNSDPDYPLPTGTTVPHMQTVSNPPLFAPNLETYPVVVFSHGYMGSPIGGDYIQALSALASYGYVVIAPFHGDLRFSDLQIDELDDAIDVLSHLHGQLKNFTAMQALRPLAISAALDLVLAHPQWGNHINTEQIGGFGASMGGETMLLLGGAGLTLTSSILSGDYEYESRQVTYDNRIKAAVGYVPWFGYSKDSHPILPAFGEDQYGLDNISLPFLGISGTADTTAPIYDTKIGMKRLTGTRELVALEGVEHGFDLDFTNDIFTWTLTFLDAEVRGNVATKKQLSTMASVAGGGIDSVVIYYNGAP